MELFVVACSATESQSTSVASPNAPSTLPAAAGRSRWAMAPLVGRVLVYSSPKNGLRRRPASRSVHLHVPLAVLLELLEELVPLQTLLPRHPLQHLLDACAMHPKPVPLLYAAATKELVVCSPLVVCISPQQARLTHAENIRNTLPDATKR